VTTQLQLIIIIIITTTTITITTTTTHDFILSKDRSLVFAAGLGPEINS